LHNSTEIKKIFQNKHLFINKRLGQNFLIDKNKRDAIINLCDIKETDFILEIGPGLGALTEAIQPACKQLTAIEKDRGLAHILKEFFSEKDNIEILNTDILDYQIPQAAKVKVIGNLPYYITSPIVFHIISQKSRIDSVFITVQKDVAKRITAKPGGKDCGVLSLSVQYHCHAEIMLNINRGAFFPVPAVDSSFLRLSIREQPFVKVEDEGFFFSIIRSGFNQRRKTLFNALCNSKAHNISKDKIEYAFHSTGISKKIRAEAIGLQEFASLSSALMSLHY
jgi:16S rRNA (adenine1518-N6/adenine1519-N6)-dimethyltransferase